MKETSTSRPFAIGNTEINPIFLEKSEELKKAEIGLQRQRLERGLREEVEAKKSSGKTNTLAADQASASDIDVSDILAKATALASGAEAEASGNTNAADDDTSFDENDYYSSRHNSPDLGLKDQADEGELNAATARHASPKTTHPVSQPSEPAFPLPLANAVSIPGLQSLAQFDQPTPNANPIPPHQPRGAMPPTPQTTRGSANNSAEADGPRGESTSRGATRGNSSHETGEASRSDGGAIDLDQGQGVPIQVHRFGAMGHGAAGQRSPALVRAHDLSPIAPQPAHVSRLAVAGRDLVAEPDLSLPRGTPAQVAALRNEGSGKSSPDSNSPQANGPKKKEKKKKKRKISAHEPIQTPYIKPEPRSVSPIAAPPGRPAKRQKQGQRQMREGVIYDEEDVRFEQAGGPNSGRYPTRSLQKSRPPSRYAPYDGQREVYYVDANPGGGPNVAHYEREYAHERRPHSQPQYETQPQPQPQPPSGRPYGVQYVGEEYGRPASQSTPTRSHQQVSQYYPEEVSRAPSYMGRPDGEFMRPQSPAIMAPPGPPLRRVVRDASGREYYEPEPQAQVIRRPVTSVVRHGEPEVIYERPASIRHSAAPQVRPAEPDVIYERSAPVRAVSRRPASNVYDDGSVIYRRPSPVYEIQRRVVTQPDVAYDNGAYQQEFAARPQPADNYHQPIERRPVMELPREYITRSVSVRPAEPIRYEMAAEHGPRMHSVHPEGQMEMVHSRSSAREYGMRPPDPHVVQPSYSVRPPERYYERPAMAEEEVAYIGERRPTRPHEVVYLEDPRGDVYR